MLDYHRKGIILLILATPFTVNGLYVDRQIGIEADTNGKGDEAFDDSLVPVINSRKKDDFGWRRRLEIDEIPSAIRHSVKGTIAELRQRILRRASQKLSETAHVKRRAQEISQQEPNSTELEIARLTLNRLIQRDTDRNVQNSGKRKSGTPLIDVLSLVKPGINDKLSRNIKVRRLGDVDVEGLFKEKKDDVDDASIDDHAHSNKKDQLSYDLESDSDDAMKYAVPVDVKIKGYVAR